MKTNKRLAGNMVLIRIALVLAAVLFFCQGRAALASGWERVGGIQLNYGIHPSAAGAYDWPWSADNGDGTTTWEGYTFDKYGGERYGVLYVYNSIASDDAYITQSFSTPLSVDRDPFEQHLSHAIAIGGATGVWIEIVYSNGDVDRVEQTSGSSWQSFYFISENNGPGTATGYSVRIVIARVNCGS